MKIITRLASASLLTSILATTAHAEQFILHTWLNPGYIVTAEGNIGFANSLREASKSELDFEVLTGGVLYPANASIEGISTGVAVAGPVPPSYHPSQFPIANAVADMGFANPDPMLLTFAYTDFTINEPAALADWTANELVFTAGGATPVYYFLCRDDVATVADLNGKRIRAPGGGLARIAEAFGATAVNIPGSEIYTAMERGAIDCAIGDATQLTSGTNIMELTKSVLMQPMNPAYITGILAYNPDFWQARSEAHRRLLLDEGAKAMVRTQIVFTAEAQAALDLAVEKGVVLYEPDEATRKAYADFVANDSAQQAEIAKTSLGIAEPQPTLDIFAAYLTKWEGLLANIDRKDEAALTALVKEQIFNKINVSAYGID